MASRTPTNVLRTVLQQEIPSVEIDDVMLEHLASALEGDAAEDEVVEAWSPFWISFSVASDEDGAKTVCQSILRRLKSRDGTSPPRRGLEAGSNAASKESEALQRHSLPAPADTPSPTRGSSGGPAVASNATPRTKQRVEEVWTEEVHGLSEWLKKMRLEKYEGEALAWCNQMGACDMDEVRDNWEDFSMQLNLKCLERKRVQKDVKDAIRSQQGHEEASSPVGATGAAAPSISGVAPGNSENLHRICTGSGLQFGNPPYTCGQSLGHGATATVYKCTRLEEGALKEYAVKVICLKKMKLNSDFEGAMDKLHRETAILFSLRHPHIVSLFDVVETREEPDIKSPNKLYFPDKLYLVMELVEGGELLDYIQRKGGMGEEEAKYVFAQLVEALKYIHDKNIVHRDLKLDNILISDRASKIDLGLIDVKISDFGHSKLLDDGYSITHTKVGTPQYWAPEVSDVDPTKGYDAKVDLWSLGVVLYVMLEGCYPFDPIRLDEQIRQAAFQFQDDTGLRPSPDARELIRGLITVSPSKRITLKECECHRWVSPTGMNARIMEPFSAFDQQVDEEIIYLPCEAKDFRQLRRDLIVFTKKFRCSATLQNKSEVVVMWYAVASNSASQEEEARGELGKLLQHHFPSFQLPPRQGIVHHPMSGNGYPVRQNHERAPRNEMPRDVVPDERPVRKPDAHSSSSFRYLKAVIRVVSGTAGLDLSEELKGMRVVGVDDVPGQRGIQVDDLITRIENVSLAMHSLPEVKQTFAQHFRDGAEVQIKRKSNRS